MVNVQKGDSEVDIIFELCSLSHDILKAASNTEGHSSLDYIFQTDTYRKWPAKCTLAPLIVSRPLREDLQPAICAVKSWGRSKHGFKHSTVDNQWLCCMTTSRMTTKENRANPVTEINWVIFVCGYIVTDKMKWNIHNHNRMIII